MQKLSSQPNDYSNSEQPMIGGCQLFEEIIARKVKYGLSLNQAKCIFILHACIDRWVRARKKGFIGFSPFTQTTSMATLGIIEFYF